MNYWMEWSREAWMMIALGLGFLSGLAVASAIAAFRLARARAELIRAQAKTEALVEARDDLQAQFRALSADTLAAQARTFTLQSRDSLSALLTPLGDKIADFRRKVEAVHEADVVQRGALKQQVETLSAQSQAVHLQAGRLANALQGDNKVLGNWGELSLRNLLDAAGLQFNRDYRLQVNLTSEDGHALQPDAIVLLPEDRCVIIDSKLSLKDYLEFYNTTDSDRRKQSLARHVAAMETHIRNLSAKKYQDLPGLPASPDFVLIFVANEPALSLAIAEKPQLLDLAASKNVVLVGPGGLLSALRLIALLWRQSHQNRATRTVFEALRKIYEKYAAFATDMQSIDEALHKAQAAYTTAYRKLSTGPGNLVRQMESFRAENYIKPLKHPPEAFRTTTADNESAPETDAPPASPPAPSPGVPPP